MLGIPTAIPEVIVLEPKVFGDGCRFFFESFNAKNFKEVTGLDVQLVQDNHLRSTQGVLRGLHYQIRQTLGKLVLVVNGEIFNIAMDTCKISPTFRKWIGKILSAENKFQFWTPAGGDHGFFVLSASAVVLYKATDYYAPAFERCILWSDTIPKITWPNGFSRLPSAKDTLGAPFCDAEVFA